MCSQRGAETEGVGEDVAEREGVIGVRKKNT
jgi:hypothetical protein